MRSDVEYFYVTDMDPEIKVLGAIDSVQLRHRHIGNADMNFGWMHLHLTPDDARELAEILLKAADHVDELNEET